MNLNECVRSFWEQTPCGTTVDLAGSATRCSREWFERVEQSRYDLEPFIHAAAQFTRHHGKKILEVGVGAGTDHLQWARAGATCYGVDLTDAGIEITRARLSEYGFKSDLRRVDAEELPFPDCSFDLVYSWGVIHHSEHPERIIAEIHRVLRPNGQLIGMMYNRHSLRVLYAWYRFALLRLRPWRSLSNVLWSHLESVGTKAYTVRELRRMFSIFSTFSATPALRNSERRPTWLGQFYPNKWGFFVILRAGK